MIAKSLNHYKIGYDPDKKQKSKLVEIEEDGAKQAFVIQIVSDKKDLEFMINKLTPPYKELTPLPSTTPDRRSQRVNVQSNQNN